MWATCSSCGFDWTGYDGDDCQSCPKCGCTKIWFEHFGFPAGVPNTRTLIDRSTGKTLDEQVDKGYTVVTRVPKWESKKATK